MRTFCITSKPEPFVQLVVPAKYNNAHSLSVINTFLDTYTHGSIEARYNEEFMFLVHTHDFDIEIESTEEATIVTLFDCSQEYLALKEVFEK